MIILNEKEYAQECLKNNDIGSKPHFTLCILAKYYYHCFGYRKKKIYGLLIDFIRKCYPRYDCNKSMWEDSIEKIAANAGKYALIELDGVWITEAEMETIKEIHNKVLERLAFTMLCLAKLNNAKNPKNNGWVNLDAKEIFTLARISCSVIARYERLGQLRERSLLEFPKKNDNLSSRVTFINDDSEKILFISDFRELGYEYLKYCGDPFIRCCECGVLTRNNKNGTKKYCSICSGYVPQETKYVTCIDCGEEFEISAKNNRAKRCAYCQNIKDRENARQRKRKQRQIDNMSR